MGRAIFPSTSLWPFSVIMALRQSAAAQNPPQSTKFCGNERALVNPLPLNYIGESISPGPGGRFDSPRPIDRGSTITARPKSRAISLAD